MTSISPIPAPSCADVSAQLANKKKVELEEAAAMLLPGLQHTVSLLNVAIQVSNDTQLHALRRHPVLRTCRMRGSGSSVAEKAFEIPESIAPSLDIDHMSLVQQPVQDGSGQGFITCEQLGPVSHRFVGGDQH